MRARVCVLRGTVGSFLVPTTSSPLQANPAGVHSSPFAFNKEFQPLIPNRTRMVLPPGWKLSATSSKAERGVSGCRCRCGIVLDIFPPVWIFFFDPLPSPICLVRLAPEWML